MKRVLVTRATRDGEGTAKKLRSLGFEPLLSPVLEIVATEAAIPRSAFDAVLATSAKALACARALPGELGALPFHAVGERTAQAAQQSGWRPHLVAASADALVALLRARYKRPAHFLYLAGHDRRDELETILRSEGHSLTVVETYEARAVGALTSEAEAALRNAEIDVVLHYSKRSAEIFCELAGAAGLIENLHDVAHLALSQEVAKPLQRLGFARVLVAEKPDEEHLLQLLSTPAN